MRRAIALSAAALAVALLTGCGSGGEETSTAAEQPSEQTQQSESGPKKYALSVQTWSPYMEVWTVDGSAVTYEKVNCIGDVESTTGTWTEGAITWDGENPRVGAGPNSTTSMAPLTDDVLRPLAAREDAVSDLEGQRAAHIEKCKEAGETVGKIVLG